jgi:hypothetical protein
MCPASEGSEAHRVNGKGASNPHRGALRGIRVFLDGARAESETQARKTDLQGQETGTQRSDLRHQCSFFRQAALSMLTTPSPLSQE